MDAVTITDVTPVEGWWWVYGPCGESKNGNAENLWWTRTRVAGWAITADNTFSGSRVRALVTRAGGADLCFVEDEYPDDEVRHGYLWHTGDSWCECMHPNQDPYGDARWCKRCAGEIDES